MGLSERRGANKAEKLMQFELCRGVVHGYDERYVRRYFKLMQIFTQMNRCRIN